MNPLLHVAHTPLHQIYLTAAASTTPLCDQIIGFPCAYESHSNMHFSKRYAILPAEWRTSFASEADANEFCDVVRRSEAKKHKNLTKSETGPIDGQSIDIRQYNATVDVPALIEMLQKLDPTLNPPGRCTNPQDLNNRTR